MREKLVAVHNCQRYPQINAEPQNPLERNLALGSMLICGSVAYCLGAGEGTGQPNFLQNPGNQESFRDQ